MSDETLFAFRRNLVVAASAGTGKTHSLVGVLVHAMLGASELGTPGRLRDPVDPSRVVATTFSRKAAAEIRARVAEELERLALGDAGRYGASMDAARVRCQGAAFAPAERARRARAALERIAYAQLGTLHGFAAALVQEHALEVGLVPGFELASENEDRRRLEGAVVWSLEACHARDPDAARALVDAAGGVDRAVVQLAAVLGRLEEDGRSPLDLAVEDDATAIEAIVRRVLGLCGELESDDKLGPLAADVRRAVASGDGALEPALERLFAVPAGGKKSPAAEALFELRAELPGSTNADRGRHLALLWGMRDRVARMGETVRRVLSDADAERRRRVLASSTLGFGDVLRVACELLRDHPDLATSLARDFDVLLVDEFQDTSRLQRDLVTLLWARAEARVAGRVPALGAMRPSGLFVVGDRKQSIYAFRGADVGVFAELCIALAGAPAREALGVPPGVAWEPETPSADFVSLRCNRRGTPGLLAFANALSRRVLRSSGPPPVLYEIDYVPATEDLLPPPETSTADPESRTLWLRPAAGDRGATRVEEAWVMAERMRRMHAGSDPFLAGARAWRDMAVLAFTNEMLDATAFALAEAGIPYVVEGRGFFAAREVRDLAAMLALIVDPSDRRALLAVLRGPWAGVHDETLIGLTDPGQGLAAPGEAWTRGERRTLVRAGDAARLRDVERVVLELHQARDRLGPAAALREAVRALDLEATLGELSRGQQRVANVRKLLVLAEAYSDCETLVRALDDAVARDLPESEAATFSEADDAVRLLTVHASKGLSFPVVFVPQMGAPFAWRGTGPFALELGEGAAPTRLACRVVADDGSVLDPPSFVRAQGVDRRRAQAERWRLLYVAITRPSHAMVLVGDRAAPARGAVAATPAAALAELAAGPEALAGARLTVEEATPSRPAAATDDAPAPPPEGAVAGPIVPTWRTLALAPTMLADYGHCPRRFQLAHLLGLPERGRVTGPRARAEAKSALDPQREGTLAHAILERIDLSFFGAPAAHVEASRILEREGLAPDHPAHAAVVARVRGFLGSEYATRAARDSARVSREHAFVMDVDGGEGRAVWLRGTIDLLVLWPDGSVDVLDYKRARGPSVAPYAFQLGVYALAAQRVAGAGAAVRAGVVFLGGPRAEPAWLPAVDGDRLRAEISTLGARLVEARWSGSFPRATIDVCRSIGCGYVRHCHP